MKKGKLFLIPTNLGNPKVTDVLPLSTLNIINNISVFIVENIRSARRFLKKAGYDKDFNKVVFHIIDKHTSQNEYPSYLKESLNGNDTGLMSETGLPCIADPGSLIVKYAHQNKLKVIPLVGPSSIFLALMASGFNGQNFVFHGYLPVKKHLREKKILELEEQSAKQDQTQIFIETPYRNMQMFNSIIHVCSNSTLICIACDLTKEEEFISTKSISSWRKEKPDIQKRPCVFLIYNS